MINFFTTHPLLVLGGYALAAAGLGFLFYCMVNAGGEKPTFVEIEETPDPWSSLPPKWHPDPAEAHLGKTHVGERRRSA